MNFKDILGYDTIKGYLQASVAAGRIPHAQLFVAGEGQGGLPMAIAYATLILSDGNPRAEAQCAQLAHPDLHFAFPTATNDKVKKDPVSALFMDEWRIFVKEQPYGSLFDWFVLLGIEKKQANIGVNEAKEITNTLALKSFEGGYKVMIVWMAEKMNTEAANKLLKLLEEPAEKTLFLLVVEDENALLDTIKSRCQILRFPLLSENAIREGLEQRGLTEAEATKIAVRAQSNFNKALQLMSNKENEEAIFERWFIAWVRSAYRARGNKTAIQGLLQWSEEVNTVGREMQKQFLQYCAEVFRQAFLLNYTASSLVYMQFNDSSFELRKFAPFIHGANIEAIYRLIEEAIVHVERNGNGKVIFTDLAIRLTRLLHAKQ
ncbi:MAG: DNA polymerase III subunit [Capnocytophaga sp.]|uniref:DNA polymerase III subunit n=1 Tax=Capnocytophaga sp. TaxID=44737 RepID=UPI003F9F0B42